MNSIEVKTTGGDGGSVPPIVSAGQANPEGCEDIYFFDLQKLIERVKEQAGRIAEDPTEADIKCLKELTARRDIVQSRGTPSTHY